MSNLMLYAVLRMPYDMAMSDELSRRQFYSRVQEAADRLELAERAQASSAPELLGGWRLENERESTIYTMGVNAGARTSKSATAEEMGQLRAAFHVNMLRAFPGKTHAEIEAEIDRACPPAASSAPAVATGGAVEQALEAAADVCGAIYQKHRDQYKGRGEFAPDNPRRADPHADGCADGASECEDAIRALIATHPAPTAEEATGGAFDEAEFNAMVEKGTKAWAGTPDGWVDELRGNVASEPAIPGTPKQAATVPGAEMMSCEVCHGRGVKARRTGCIQCGQCQGRGQYLRAAATTDGEGES